VGAVAGRRDQVKVGGPLADILLWSLLCARIGFVALYFEHYWDDPLGIIDIPRWRLPSAVRPDRLCHRHRVSALAPSIGARGTGDCGDDRDPALGPSWGLINLMQAQGRVSEVTVESRDGEALALDTMADGRPMVVNLWASWCPPCVREMPVLEEAQETQRILPLFSSTRGRPADG